MKKRVLFIQHVPQEGPGTMGVFFREKGVPYQILEVFRADGRVLCDVDLNDVMGVIILGGPMGVYDEAENLFLVAEKCFIRELICAGIPLLGICLGAQLLASALGARITKSPFKEVGWYKVDLCEAAGLDPLFKDFDADIPVFQWHEDTFEVPAGGYLLAESGGFNQAFRVGDRAWGLQFHVEVDSSMIRSWAAAARPGEVSVDHETRMIKEHAGIRAPYQAQARRFTEAFLEGALAQGEQTCLCRGKT